jgi:hypothetical protein
MVEHLSSGFFCTHAEHDAQFKQHWDTLLHDNDDHTRCQGLQDFAARTDPKLKRNSHIPNFIDARYFYRGDHPWRTAEHYVNPNWMPDLTSQASLIEPEAAKLLYEGTSNDNEEPPRLCLLKHEHTIVDTSPSLEPDIDSACGEVDSFGVFLKGWSMFPFMNLQMSGRVHGIYLRIDDSKELGKSHMVQPQDIPNVLIGELSSWGYIKIYFLFPNIWLQRRRPNSTSILTDDQREVLYDRVIRPALESTMSSTDLGEIPMSFETARIQALATSTESGRVVNSRAQQLKNEIRPDRSHAFTLACRRNIRNERLCEFEDFRIFFVGKGMKDSERRSTYTDLYHSWTGRWREEFDIRYAPPKKHWFDLGRQFAPSAGNDKHVLLWKRCCIDKYYTARTKRYGHQKTLPLQRHHLASCRDLISATMTAAKDSPQFHAGLPHSVLYSKTKCEFVTNTVEVFDNDNINILAYGQSHINAVTSVAAATTATMKSAATSLICSKVRSSTGASNLGERDSQPREEHRQRGDVFEETMQGMMAKEAASGAYALNPDNDNADNQEQDAQGAEVIWQSDIMPTYQRKMLEATVAIGRHNATDPATLTRHLPFFIVRATTFSQFLRGSINKACMGFEMVLRDINSIHVEPELTATALMFLSLMRFSLLTKSLSLAPELYRDRWKSAPKKQQREKSSSLGEPSNSSLLDEEEEEQEVYEGMAMGSTMKKFGYGYFSPQKMDWASWRISRDHVDNFFRDEPAFARVMKARRSEVLGVDQALKVVGFIREWLRYATTAQQISAIYDFSIGFLMITYRGAIWEQLKINKTLAHHPQDVIKSLISGKVPLTFSNVARFVRDRDFKFPDLNTSNRVDHKGDPMNILEYLFGTTPYFTPDGVLKKREHWDPRMFRLAFAQVYAAFSARFTRREAAQWKQDFFCVVHATNPLLPVPDGTQLLSRKQKKGYAWAAFDWIEGLGPFKHPISCRELVQLVYPQGHGKHVTEYCRVNGGRYFDGVPPQLEYETEFFEKSANDIKRNMKRKLDSLG